MPDESKEPLRLLANMIITQYDVALDRTLLSVGSFDKDFYRDYLPKSAQRVKNELGINVDNVFPYILQAAIWSELKARREGNPQGIFHCVEDVVRARLFSTPTLASRDYSESMDPEFQAITIDVMQKVATASSKKGSGFGRLFGAPKAESPVAEEETSAYEHK